MNKNKYVPLAALAASALAFAAYAQTSTNEHGKVLKTLSCPPECGFSITSRDEKEIIESTRLHAKNVHHMELSDEQIKAMIK